MSCIFTKDGDQINLDEARRLLKSEHGKKDDLVEDAIFKGAIGCPVYITENTPQADLRYGVMNGTHGTIAGYISSDATNIETVLVQLDNPPACLPLLELRFANIQGRPIVRQYSGIIPIGRRNCTKRVGDSYVRGSYFPLKLSYVTTVHKAQGRTLEDLVTDLNDPLTNEPLMTYVVLSRIKDFSHLHLTSQTSLDMLNLAKKGKGNYLKLVQKEYNRLHVLQEQLMEYAISNNICADC
jgi:ATP-dependent exoDNAse (exonuclease V) alpha subunit